MKIDSKFLIIIFACALISTPKIESKTLTPNGLLLVGNSLIALLSFNDVCTNPSDGIAYSQCLFAIKTINHFYNNYPFLKNDREFTTIVNALFTIGYIYKAAIAEKKEGEQISKERIRALILAIFYALNTYKLDK